MGDSSAISTKKLKSSLREYIWDSPILRYLFSSALLVSLMILVVIWMLDIAYGKTFQCNSTREVVQHMGTTFIVVASGIALNNLTLKSKYKKDDSEPVVERSDTHQIIAEYV